VRELLPFVLVWQRYPQPLGTERDTGYLTTQQGVRDTDTRV
ncbi:Mycobacterium rhizamassiliense ORFan, partial [Mycobacterium rhizamassiliense]